MPPPTDAVDHNPDGSSKESLDVLNLSLDGAQQKPKGPSKRPSMDTNPRWTSFRKLPKLTGMQRPPP